MDRRHALFIMAVVLGAVWWSAFEVAAPASALPAAPTFTLNSTADVVDANPGDGKCETQLNNGVCTLRAAIMESNHTAGGGATVKFGLPGTVTYTLGIPAPDTEYQSGEESGDLNISRTVTIIGNGANKTIIDANGSVIQDRILYVVTGTVSISGVTLTNGRKTYNLNPQVDNPNAFAGGIVHNDALTLTNSVVSRNAAIAYTGAAYGGGIYSGGRLTLIHSAVVSNIVTTTVSGYASGGGIAAGLGLLVLNSTIAGNIARDNGGGVFGGGRFVNSTLSGNTARNGGALSVGDMTLINSTVSGNYANDNGGGIYHSGSTMRLFNATIVGNTANNKAVCCGYGGGIYNSSGGVNFQNSILASNIFVYLLSQHHVAEPEDCWGTLTSQGYNIVSETTDCTINGSFIQAYPAFGPLQDNGGPTLTYALLPGSRGVDEGQPGDCTDDLGAPLTTDQRGYPRPANGAGVFRCDIGAYELQRLLMLPLVRR